MFWWEKKQRDSLYPRYPDIPEVKMIFVAESKKSACLRNRKRLVNLILNPPTFGQFDCLNVLSTCASFISWIFNFISRRIIFK